VRVLFLAPFVTARIAHPLSALAHSMLKLGHEVQVLARQVTRVHTDKGPVLSRNESSIEKLRQQVGTDRVSLLHAHSSRMPGHGETRLEEVDTQRVQSWMEIFCPDLVIFSGLEFAGEDPVLKAVKTTHLLTKTLQLQQEANLTWTLNDSSDQIVTNIAKESDVLLKALRQTLPKLFDRPRSTQIQSSILNQESEQLRALVSGTASVASPTAMGNAATSTPTAEVHGELESLKDDEVVFGKNLWIKGWLDCSPSQGIREIEVLINDRSHYLKADTVRGEIAEKLKNPDVFGFDAWLPLHSEGPRLNVTLNLQYKDGRKQIWQRRALWANDCIPEVHSIPIVLGHAEIERAAPDHTKPESAGWLSGSVKVDEHLVHRLVAFQRGQQLADIELAAPEGSVAERYFRHALSSSTYEPTLPLDLWIEMGDEHLIHWLRCDPLFEPPVSTRSWAVTNAENGNVVRGTTFHCTISPLDEGVQPIVFVNGQQQPVVLVPCDQPNHVSLAVPIGGAGNDLQVRVECGSAHQTLQLWHHIDVGTSPVQRSVTVPRFSSVAAPVRSHDQGAPRSVLVIRKAPSPTDELYITAPLTPLHDRGDIRMKVVDLDHETDRPPDMDQLLTPGTAVVISRYISERWIAAITKHKARLGPVFYLMDDDVAAAVDSHHLPLNYRQRMGKVACGEFQTLIRLCDQFIVTSPHLLSRYSSAKTVLLEPCYLQSPSHLNHLDDQSEIIITYQGTEGHKDDLAAIAPALRSIHDEFKRVILKIIIGHPRAVPAILKDLKRLEVIKPMTWIEYKKFRATSRAHIALAPMLNTPYNGGKSIIKIFDIAALGAAGIYSNCPPYNSVVEHGVNGLLLDNDPLLWRKAIKWLIERPEELQQMARAGQALATTRGHVKRLQNYWFQGLGLGMNDV
jgi:glycosyltransferase involved in cell wall biosynthesis